MCELPYANINLRFNPFGELNPDERQQLACVDVVGLAQYLDAPRTAVQFLAGHGRGKTTHLLALHQQCLKFPYIKLHQGDKPVFDRSEGYFIDSIENLSLLKRITLYRRFKHLAVTTHRDLSTEMKLSGLRVKTIEVSVTQLGVLQEIFQQRLDYARRSDGDTPEIGLDRVKELQRKHGDDIRAMEAELYDYFDLLRSK